MYISRFTVELMAAIFGKQSLSYQALQKAKEMGNQCRFFLKNNQFEIEATA